MLPPTGQTHAEDQGGRYGWMTPFPWRRGMPGGECLHLDGPAPCRTGVGRPAGWCRSFQAAWALFWSGAAPPGRTVGDMPAEPGPLLAGLVSRLDSTLLVLRTRVCRLAEGGVPPIELVAVHAALDQMQAAVAQLRCRAADLLTAAADDGSGQSDDLSAEPTVGRRALKPWTHLGSEVPDHGPTTNRRGSYDGFGGWKSGPHGHDRR